MNNRTLVISTRIKPTELVRMHAYLEQKGLAPSSAGQTISDFIQLITSNIQPIYMEMPEVESYLLSKGIKLSPAQLGLNSRTAYLNRLAEMETATNQASTSTDPAVLEAIKLLHQENGAD